MDDDTIQTQKPINKLIKKHYVSSTRRGKFKMMNRYKSVQYAAAGWPRNKHRKRKYPNQGNLKQSGGQDKQSTKYHAPEVSMREVQDIDEGQWKSDEYKYSTNMQQKT